MVGRSPNCLLRNLSRPTMQVLNFDTNLFAKSIDNLYHVNMSQVLRQNVPPEQPQLDCSLCQKDELEIFETLQSAEPNLKSRSKVSPFNYFEVENESLKPSKSFRNLVKQMLSPSLEKSIQTLTPEQAVSESEGSSKLTTDGQSFSKNLTEPQEALEKQIQQLSDLIQRKTIYAIQAIDYPIASKAVDKLLEQEPVGFSDALCFVLNAATKSSGKIQLTHSNATILCQKFHKLTAVLENLRKTRLKLFTRFDKEINGALDRIIESNSTCGMASFDENDAQISLSLGLENENYTMQSDQQEETAGLTQNETPGNNSFEGLFWGNYCSVLKSLDENVDSKSREVSEGSLQPPPPSEEIKIQWEAWNKDEISCIISPEKMMHLSQLTQPMVMNILLKILDLVTTNFSTANSLLQQSLDDFKKSKIMLKSMSRNITSSNLNTTEVKEVLKIIRVALATSVTILKSIEKTTRIGRFFILEGIQNLARVLKQNGSTNKSSYFKLKQFVYKPNYLALSFTMKCDPEMLALLDTLESKTCVLNTNGKNHSKAKLQSQSELPMQISAHRQSKSNFDQENIPEPKPEPELPLNSQSEVKLEVIEPQGKVEREKTISESRIIIPSEIDLNAKNFTLPPLGLMGSPMRLVQESTIDFFDDFEKINELITERIQISHDILCLPNTAVWPEDDGHVPFALGLCSILAKMLIGTQPQRDVPARYKHLIRSSLKQLINSTNFGKERKDFIRDIARELTTTDTILENFSALLLLNKQNKGNSKPSTSTSGSNNRSNSSSYYSSVSANGNPNLPSTSGQSILLSEILVADKSEKEKREEMENMWQIQWASDVDGILVKHVESLRQTNYANISLKAKCQLVGAVLRFADNAFDYTGLNLRAAEMNLRGANSSLKKLRKKVESLMKKQGGLTMEEKLIFGHIFNKLGQSHMGAVTVLGKLNNSLSQVASILFVVSEYLRAEDHLQESITYGTSATMTGRSKSKSQDGIEYRIKQAGEYINSLFLFPISIRIPIKLSSNQVCIE